MGTLPFPRISPWVARIVVVAAVVQVLLATVFTAPVFVDALSFVPALAFVRPWTFVTYIFVHGGLLHLLLNAIFLLVLGPSVERRMGTGKFLAYFLYCGIGAAAFTVALNVIHPVGPFIGMSGAVMGVAIAYAILLPDRELLIFPLPVPIRAPVLVALLAGFDLLGAFFWHDGIAHEAHLGGLLFGWLFFRLNALVGGPLPKHRPLERVVLVSHGVSDDAVHGVPRSAPARRSRPTGSGDTAAEAELDRLLDKIGATGIESLTGVERRFLDEFSRRKQFPH
ncbi:MAG: rhomboid family intramembrane serine protease [Gemmatimonadales bacterium]